MIVSHARLYRCHFVLTGDVYYISTRVCNWLLSNEDRVINIEYNNSAIKAFPAILNSQRNRYPLRWLLYPITTTDSVLVNSNFLIVSIFTFLYILCTTNWKWRHKVFNNWYFNADNPVTTCQCGWLGYDLPHTYFHQWNKYLCTATRTEIISIERR